jgi:hypothetical protein
MSDYSQRQLDFGDQALSIVKKNNTYTIYPVTQGSWLNTTKVDAAEDARNTVYLPKEHIQAQVLLVLKDLGTAARDLTEASSPSKNPSIGVMSTHEESQVYLGSLAFNEHGDIVSQGRPASKIDGEGWDDPNPVILVPWDIPSEVEVIFPHYVNKWHVNLGESGYQLTIHPSISNDEEAQSRTAGWFTSKSKQPKSDMNSKLLTASFLPEAEPTLHSLSLLARVAEDDKLAVDMYGTVLLGDGKAKRYLAPSELVSLKPGIEAHLALMEPDSEEFESIKYGMTLHWSTQTKCEEIAKAAFKSQGYTCDHFRDHDPVLGEPDDDTIPQAVELSLPTGLASRELKDGEVFKAARYTARQIIEEDFEDYVAECDDDSDADRDLARQEQSLRELPEAVIVSLKPFLNSTMSNRLKSDIAESVMSAVMKDAVDKREEGLGTDYHLEPRFSKEEGTSVRTADDIVLELETVFKPLSL